MNWAWVYWLAAADALLIVAAGVWVLARPPVSLPRLTGRAAAAFLVGFGLKVLATNVAQLVLYTDTPWRTDFKLVSYVGAVVVGFLSGAFGLIFAFRMRDHHARRAEGFWVTLTGLFAVVVAALAGFGVEVLWGGVAQTATRVVLPMAVALLLLARLRWAVREADEYRVEELAWTLLGFLPFAAFHGLDLALYFPKNDLVAGAVCGLAVLLCLAYIVQALVVNLRHAITPTWAILTAVGIGILTAGLQTVQLFLSPLWGAVNNDLVSVGILLALYRWHALLQTASSPNGLASRQPQRVFPVLAGNGAEPPVVGRMESK